MKSSRYYQNWLQVVARLSAIAIFISGYYFTSKDYKASFVFLLLNLLADYYTSSLKFERSKSIEGERKNNLIKKLKKPDFYQFCVQVTGRGRTVLSFYAGLLLGGGSGWAIMVLLVQIFLGFLTTEFLYLREQSVYNRRGGG